MSQMAEGPPEAAERAPAVGVCAGCLDVIEGWSGTSNMHQTSPTDACGPVFSPAEAGDYALNEIDNAQQSISHSLAVIATASDFIAEVSP